MPYRTMDNRIDGVVITFTDITTAKQLERDLRATAGQFQTLLDRLNFGYALCSAIPGPGGAVADGRLTRCNRAFSRLLPAGAGPAEGRSLLEVLPAMGPVFGAALAQAPLAGGFQVLEQYLELAGANYEIMIYRPTDDQFACIFRNITDPRPFTEAPTDGFARTE